MTAEIVAGSLCEITSDEVFVVATQSCHIMLMSSAFNIGDRLDIGLTVASSS